MIVSKLLSSRRICAFVCLMAICLNYASGTVSLAIEAEILPYDKDDQRAENGVYAFTEGGACASGSSGSGGGDVDQSDNEKNLQYVYGFMLGLGLEDWQAAGVVGNIAQESGGDPTLIQTSYHDAYGASHTDDPSDIGGPKPNGPYEVGSGKAWGLIQWDSGGRAVNYARDAGITEPIHLLTTQVRLVEWHMRVQTPTGLANFWESYEKTADLATATEQYMLKMEAPGIPHLAGRLAAAQLALDEYPKTKYYADGSTDSSEGGGGCISNIADGSVSGDAIKTAVNYAWPEYSRRKTDLKPEYESAVKKAIDEGAYVGGRDFPGVDCGGFVTRVMQDSGVDPDYNTDPGGGTTEQMTYLRSSSNFIEIGAGGTMTTADLKPGDIAIRDGHTYMYVGKVDGFGSEIASASLDSRAPMAGKEVPADKSYQWYRFTGGATEV